MRKFSQDEQYVIRMMVEHTDPNRTLQPFLPINLFNDVFQIGTIGFDAKAKQLLFSDIKGNHQTFEQMMYIYNTILERVMLLEYLQKEGLIYIVPMATTTNSLFQTGTISQQNVGMPLTPSINDFLFRCLNEPLYVGETLRALVSDNFMSLDELSLRESKKQTIFSIIAVALAFLTLLIGMIQNCSGEKKDSHSDVESANVSVPVSTMLNNMQNNLNGKLDATMNNTAEIKAKLADSIIIKNPCGCKRPTATKTKRKQQKDGCIKYLRVNTCRDTVVEKR